MSWIGSWSGFLHCHSGDQFLCSRGCSAASGRRDLRRPGFRSVWIGTSSAFNLHFLDIDSKRKSIQPCSGRIFLETAGTALQWTNNSESLRSVEQFNPKANLVSVTKECFDEQHESF